MTTETKEIAEIAETREFTKEYMTSEEYCNQKVRDIQKKTKLIIEPCTPKVEVLVLAAEEYKKMGKISDKTFEMVNDPRFVRLYNSKIRYLKRLLSDNNLETPKQGKGKIVEMCFEHNIDVPQDVSISYSTSNSNESDEEERFTTKNGVIYYNFNGNSHPIPRKSLMELFNVLLNHFN